MCDQGVWCGSINSYINYAKPGETLELVTRPPSFKSNARHFVTESVGDMSRTLTRSTVSSHARRSQLCARAPKTTTTAETATSGSVHIGLNGGLPRNSHSSHNANQRRNKRRFTTAPKSRKDRAGEVRDSHLRKQ